MSFQIFFQNFHFFQEWSQYLMGTIFSNAISEATFHSRQPRFSFSFQPPTRRLWSLQFFQFGFGPFAEQSTSRVLCEVTHKTKILNEDPPVFSRLEKFLRSLFVQFYSKVCYLVLHHRCMNYKYLVTYHKITICFKNVNKSNFFVKG